MHAKTLALVSGVGMGIAIGYRSLFATEAAVAAFLASVLLGTLSIIERKREAHGFSFSFYGMLIACGIMLGIVRVQFEHELPPLTCDASCSIQGVIVSDPESKDAYQQFALHVDDAHQDILVRVPLYPKYNVGETVSLVGKVTLPSMLSSFDYTSYLKTKSIGSIVSYPKIIVLDEDAHTLPLLLMRMKEKLVENMNRYIASPASLLASGMLFGAASFPQELKDAFRAAGLSHIVVLSGFNIAVVVSFVLFVFMFLPLFVRIALASLLVVLFVMMVGGEASVIRATIMTFISLLALIAGREYVAKQALLISFLSIIFYQPFALLHDASLHLSFLATAGIVYGNDIVLSLLERRVAYPSFAQLLATTLCAFVSTTPYILYAFGTVSMYSLPANLIVLPFIPLMMLLAFLTLLGGLTVSFAGSVFGFATTLVGKWIIFVVQAIASLPFASVQLSISFLGMAFLYACIFSAYAYLSFLRLDETFRTKEGYLADVLSF